MRLLIAGFFLLLIASHAQEAKEGNAGDAQKMVTIRQIQVEGTRLPANSVIRLAQLKPGDQVNFLTLNSTLQKITHSGLIDNVAFEYQSLPDKETDVVLHMKCKDVPPASSIHYLRGNCHRMNPPFGFMRIGLESIWKATATLLSRSISR